MNKNIVLKNIASIKFGIYVKPDEKGDVLYLQAKNFDDLGCMKDENFAFSDLEENDKSHLLQNGDVLFVGKGFRYFAWVYDSSIGRAIASSIFYVIRCNKSKVNPYYLATIFNSQKYQGQFQNLAAGSSIPSIRKAELENLKIDLPTLENQEKVAEVNALHIDDVKLSNQIIQLKKTVFENVINSIIK